MKLKQLNHAVVAGIVTLTLAGCDGLRPQEEKVVTNAGGNDSSAPEIAAGLPEDPYVNVEQTTNGVLVPVPQTETADIVVQPDFDFKTSRKVAVNLNVPEARGVTTSLSFCTDYQVSSTGFDVDYTSCTVNAPMVDGRFDFSLDVMNQYDSVLAVVWFPEEGLDPVFQELSVNSN